MDNAHRTAVLVILSGRDMSLGPFFFRYPFVRALNRIRPRSGDHAARSGEHSGHARKGQKMASRKTS